MTDLRKKLAYDETFSCVQCGYCLPSCPTYLTFGKETHSPRGRINLVKMASEGKITIEDLANPIDLCLGCRACETACPTNVQYGKILTSAVNVIEEYRKKDRSKKEKFVRQVIFHKTLPNKKLLNVLGKGLFVFQKTKANTVARKLKAFSLLPEALGKIESITPTTQLPVKRKQVKVEQNANVLKIGFFPGCVMDTVFAEINDLAIRLLELGGCEVTTIREQGCCGALQQHAGEKELAIQLAKKNIEAFERYEFDYIVNAIGGCGAALVEYHHYFDEKDPWHARAKQFSEKNKDISLLLAKVELPLQRNIEKRVTYQPSCHLTNVQKVTEEPLQLLKSIPGITYIPMQQKDLCCGSAGIYNVIHHAESMHILEHKMKNTLETTPEIIVTTNPGCHLQMLIGVKNEGLEDKIQVQHLVQLLAHACKLI